MKNSVHWIALIFSFAIVYIFIGRIFTPIVNPQTIVLPSPTSTIIPSATPTTIPTPIPTQSPDIKALAINCDYQAWQAYSNAYSQLNLQGNLNQQTNQLIYSQYLNGRIGCYSQFGLNPLHPPFQIINYP